MALIKLNNQSISAVSALPSGIDTGKVAQVVSGTSSTEQSTTSSSYTNSNLTVNITPSASNSKIFIIVSCSISLDIVTSFETATYTIRRGTTDLSSGQGMNVFFTNAVTDYRGGCYIHFLDSPNTTSQVTYSLAHKVNNSRTSKVNRDGTTGSITAMEILT